MKLIPTIKTTFNGDISACKEFIKPARAQLEILERQMAYQNLNEGRRVVSPFEGVTIECISRFGKPETIITVVQGEQHFEYIADEGITKVIKKKKLLEEKQLFYFIRIKAPDHEQWPRDRDGINADQSEVAMDRIILCDIAFNGNVDNIDPELDNTDNRANGFTPGGTVVAYDVDILKDIVYYPENLAVADQVPLLNKIKEMAVTMPANADPNPDGCLLDIALEHYGYGGVSDPINNAGYGGYDQPTEVVVYDLSYTYEIDGVGWHPIINRVPDSDEAEADDFGGLLLSLWRADWSPLYGGDPDGFTDIYDFTNLLSVLDHYGEFEHNFSDGSSLDYYVIGKIEISGFTYSIVVETNLTQPIDPAIDTIIDGTFFAPITLTGYESTSLPFFCLFMSEAFTTNWTHADIFAGAHQLEPPYDWVIEYALSRLEATWTQEEQESMVTSVITPLEEVSMLEMLMDSSGSLPPCSEAPCWFSMAPSVFAYWLSGPDGIDAGTDVILEDYAPCPVPTDYIGDYGYIIKNGSSKDTHRYTSFHIPDPSYPEYENGQKNFASLFIFAEVRELRSQGSCKKTGVTNFLPNDICICSGNTFVYSELESNTSPYSSAGVLIYLFAPKELFADGNTTDISWDIHTARRDEDIINPYRCLVLEEYINTVITGIQEDLNNMTTIPMAADSVAFTMNYYGMSISDGFVKKGTFDPAITTVEV